MNRIDPARYARCRAFLVYTSLLLAGSAIQSSEGQSNPSFTVQLYPGLKVSGTVGDSYTIQYVKSLPATNWTTLTNFILYVSPTVWVDTSVSSSSERYYRVITTPVSNAPPPPGMVLVPAGSFTMGDNLDGEADAPTNTVYVSAYYMDINLITYAQWQQIHTWATSHGYSFDNAGSGKATNQPVQTIDWYDAVKWCNARSQMDGVAPVYFTDTKLTQVYTNGDSAPYVNWNAAGYRLPTEAEWEKGARGGLAGKRFPLGNSISQSQANYYGDPGVYTYDLGPAGYDPAFGNGIGVDTSPASYFPANGYGLCDMAGNLSEWCWDWYGPYQTGIQSNPQGPSQGSFRILRGGNWLISAYSLRCANRNYYYPALTGDAYGFRCVMPAAGE